METTQNKIAPLAGKGEVKKPQRKPDRQAVAQSLRDLEILFGKKPPDRNENAAGKSGAGEPFETLLTGKLTSRGAK